jgi:arginyl-tRNA--protein-N-Asp/Glu arginylyltransferase
MSDQKSHARWIKEKRVDVRHTVVDIDHDLNACGQRRSKLILSYKAGEHCHSRQPVRQAGGKQTEAKGRREDGEA